MPLSDAASCQHTLKPMKWAGEVIEGVFQKRYKRFFADVDLNGNMVTAHVANTGSLLSCSIPGSRCWVTKVDDPKRKLQYSLQAIQSQDGAWVGVNTSIPNQLVKEAYLEKKLWREFVDYKAEVKISSETRLDFCFYGKSRNRFVEVKNVSYREGEQALFPDAKSERGQKHLVELMKLIEQGHEAEIVYIIQRADCKRFAPAELIDPEYASLLQQARKSGVLISPYLVELSLDGLALSNQPLPLGF